MYRLDLIKAKGKSSQFNSSSHATRTVKLSSAVLGGYNYADFDGRDVGDLEHGASAETPESTEVRGSEHAADAHTHPLDVGQLTRQTCPARTT